MPPPGVTPADLGQRQPRPAEAPARLQPVDHRPGHRAFDPRALCLERSADHRVDQPAADVGADRDRPRQVEQFDPRQAPQRVDRPRIAELHPHRRIDQGRRVSAPPPSGAKRACARPMVLPSLTATARSAAFDPSSIAAMPDVDRLRRQHQPGAAEVAHAQVGAPARPPGPAIVDPPARHPAKPEPRIEDVEQLHRHAGDVGVKFGRRAALARNRRAPAAEAHPRRRQRPAARRRGSAPPDCRGSGRAARPGPRPVRLMRSGATSATVTNSNAWPRRPASVARTCPAPLTSRADARQPREARRRPTASPRATNVPSTLVAPGRSRIVPSTRPSRTAIGGGPGKLTLIGGRDAPRSAGRRRRGGSRACPTARRRRRRASR